MVQHLPFGNDGTERHSIGTIVTRPIQCISFGSVAAGEMLHLEAGPYKNLVYILIATSPTRLFCSSSQRIIQAMMPTATQIMAQPQVVSRQSDPWTTAIHPSEIVPSTTIPLAHARTAWMTITRTLLSRSQCHLRHIPSDRLSSEGDS